MRLYSDQTDSVPDAFSFTAQTNAARSTLMQSNTITVQGMTTGVTISVSNGVYNISGGSFTASAGTVFSGDQVILALTSSASYSTLSTAILTIGSVTGALAVTTLAEA